VTSIIPLDLPGVFLLEPKLFRDSRGVLAETFRAEILAEAGVDRAFVQDNVSISERRGTVRGMHFQAPPHDHDKLIRVARGAILDVAVDLRTESPTYGRSVAVELSVDNWRQLLVPRGFAHGFCTLEDDTQVCYKLTGYYVPAAEGGLLWSDPALGIDWPVSVGEAVVSDKDAVLPGFAQFKSPFEYDRPG
jgi:dTDP-4-dehydrorhamnose 3,5-epimerase